MDQKAKKIKDQTVRSLESEVQKIMNRFVISFGLSLQSLVDSNGICTDMLLS